jgi:Tfp pilus assembly protein PilX
LDHNTCGAWRRVRQRLEQDRGFALVLALAVTFVFSMMVVAIIESASSNSRSSDRSRGRVSAYALAEAGINDAVSILTKSNAYDAHVLHPQAPYAQADCASPPVNPAGSTPLGNTCSPYTWSYDGGTTTMWGWFDSSSSNWTITSNGSVRNAFGGSPTSRTLTATVHIRAKASQLNVVPAWNYVFVEDTAPNICNVTLDNTTALSSSLYVEGNLCFKNSAGISEPNPADPVLLEVRGKLVWLTGATKGVGDSSTNPVQQVTSAKIGGGCANGSVLNAAHVCSPSAPTNDYFYVKSGGYSTVAPPIAPPVVTSADWDAYYANATISRLKPCNAGGLASSAFDNDTIRNSSLPTTFVLTSPSNYTCQTTNSSGAVVGELDWNAATRVLQVRGTVFIDGNVSIDGVVKYRGVDAHGTHPSGSDGSDGLGGMMVMYVSGTVSLTNTGVFCGWNTNSDSSAYSSGSCDFNSWTPATSMFMFIAGGGVTLNQGSYFQGAIYTAGAVTLGQSAQTEGPIIAASITLGQSVKMKPLPGLADLPLGAPGNPNTSGVPEAPTYGAG